MSDYNVTIRRHNGTGYDALYPKTKYANITDKDTYANVANGWLKLDGSAKIPTSLFPSSIVTSMQFAGAVSGTSYDTTAELITAMETYASANSHDEKGLFFIFTADTTITIASGHTVYSEEDGGEITGTGSNTVTIEKGDWFVCTAYTSSSSASFAIINNTYQDADTSAPGIVQLSSNDGAWTTTTGNKVVTDYVLASLVDSGITSGSEKLAKSGQVYSSLALKGNLSGGNTWSGAQTFSGNILFSATDTYNIGSATYRANNIYSKYAEIGGMVFDSTAITATAAELDINNIIYGGDDMQDVFSLNSALGSSTPTFSAGGITSPVAGTIWFDTSS